MFKSVAIGTAAFAASYLAGNWAKAQTDSPMLASRNGYVSLAASIAAVYLVTRVV